MTYGMAAATGLLLWAACSEPSYADRKDGGREAADAAIDLGTDAGAQDASSVEQKGVDGAVQGMPSVRTGGPVRTSKTLRLTDDGFENQGRSCGVKLCAEGGILP